MTKIIVRQLEKNDINNGYLDIFDSDRKPVSTKEAEEIFSKIRTSKFHKIFVGLKDSEIIGTITLIVEPKFIRNGGIVGHIEDVEIKKKYRKHGYGKELLHKVLEVGCGSGGT